MGEPITGGQVRLMSPSMGNQPVWAILKLWHSGAWYDQSRSSLKTLRLADAPVSFLLSTALQGETKYGKIRP